MKDSTQVRHMWNANVNVHEAPQNTFLLRSSIAGRTDNIIWKDAAMCWDGLTVNGVVSFSRHDAVYIVYLCARAMSH